MQTQTSRFPLPPVQYTFAGFTFPRRVAQLPKGTIGQRLEKARNPVTGPLYTFGNLDMTGEPKGWGGYLTATECAGMRWAWCDEVEGVGRSIDHKGWFTDDEGTGDTIRGIVVRLPRSRGFLAGWSMGEGMATSLDLDIYETERDAAITANSIAENAAEAEREYQEKVRAEEEEEEEDTDDGEDCATTAKLLQDECNALRGELASRVEQTNSLMATIQELRGELATLKATRPAMPLISFDGHGFSVLADPYRTRFATLNNRYKPNSAEGTEEDKALASAILDTMAAAGVLRL